MPITIDGVTVPVSRFGLQIRNQDGGLGFGHPDEYYIRLTESKHGLYGGGVCASIGPIHTPNCKVNRKPNKCTCDAELLWREFCESHGDPWVLPGYETIESQMTGHADYVDINPSSKHSKPATAIATSVHDMTQEIKPYFTRHPETMEEWNDNNKESN